MGATLWPSDAAGRCRVTVSEATVARIHVVELEGVDMLEEAEVLLLQDFLFFGDELGRGWFPILLHVDEDVISINETKIT